MYGMSDRSEWNNRGDWGRRGRGHHHGPHGFFFIPVLLLAGFVFFGLFKFLFPLIVIGVVIAVVSAKMRGGFGHGGWEGRGREFWNQRWNWENEWSEKRKHDWMGDEKPKRDD